MKIGFIEPFDQYANTGTGSLGFLSVWSQTKPIERHLVSGLIHETGQAIQLIGDSVLGDAEARRPFPNETSKLSFAFFFKREVPVARRVFFRFKTSAGGEHFGIAVEPTGKFVLVSSGGSTIATASGEWLMEGQVVYHCACAVDLSGGTGSTGSFKLWINGNPNPIIDVSAMDLTNQSSPLIGMVAFELMEVVENINMTLDHMIMVEDEFMQIPEVELTQHLMTADDSVAWIPLGAGDNYEEINDLPVDGDTSYNSTNTANAKDKFVAADSPETPESIFAVSLMLAGRKEESATRGVNFGLDLGDGTESDGENEAFLSVGNTFYWNHWEVDPSTAAAWQPAAINALKPYYELTTGGA